jgi:hypothetical protein
MPTPCRWHRYPTNYQATQSTKLSDIELTSEEMKENYTLQEDTFDCLESIHLGLACCVPSRSLELLIPGLFYLHQHLA